MINIFTIQEGNIALSPNVLIVPEFKKLVDTREDHLLIFKYIYSLYHYDSPYSDTPEKDKESMIITDLKLDISLDDADIISAKDKAYILYMTPTKRFYMDAKIGMEKMGAYLREATIESGRDGNLSAIGSTLKSVGMINAQFKILEKDFKEEQASGNRGGHESSYDETQ